LASWSDDRVNVHGAVALFVLTILKKRKRGRTGHFWGEKSSFFVSKLAKFFHFSPLGVLSSSQSELLEDYYFSGKILDAVVKYL